MKPRAALLALAAVLLGAVLPGTAEAKPNKIQLPTGEVFCAYSKKKRPYVRCEATFLSGSVAGFIHKTGRGRFRNVSSSIVDRSAPVLRYGKKRRFGPFVCMSSRTYGLRCKSRRSGHSIFLSRKRQGVS